MISADMSRSAEILQTVKETLEETEAVVLTIVYGSLASDTLRDDSDVDVAVLCHTELHAEEKLILTQTLGERLGREVDLVDLRAASGVLLKQILTKGKILIKRDDGAYAELLKRMIYNQEDYMPYFQRALKERMERFVNGQGAD